jgi:hypothetical protein
MAAIHPLTTASRPFCALVGRWKILVETASPFSQTAAILEVVAPLSVPMKIFRFMSGVKLRMPAAKARIIKSELKPRNTQNTRKEARRTATGFAGAFVFRVFRG